MDFSNALKMLAMKVPMARTEWEDRKEFVILDDGLFKKNLRLTDWQYDLLPYQFSHEDLLAEDWEVTRR